MSNTVLNPPAAEDRHIADRHGPSWPKRWISWIFGWGFRVLVGVWFCFNFYLLSYLTSILVVGWLYRWMQGRVFHGLWKNSARRQQETFAQTRLALGSRPPVLRPRWFWPETGRVPSLWINFKTGIVALVCTYLILGWGCALMTFGWEYGWVNSFHKGYERTFVGPLVSVGGVLLFVAAMLYVPMAQVHMAATGDYRAFFDGRFVWKLIQTRLGAYVLACAALALLALPLEVLKTAPLAFYESDAWRNATDAQVMTKLSEYLRSVALVLFFSLLLSHALLADVYRSALLRVVRLGEVRETELHPTLRHWLVHLDLLQEPTTPRKTLIALVGRSLRWWTRRWLYAALVAIWVAFALKVYLGEFLNYHPVVGFMNHPLIQFPCVDYIPSHLVPSQ